MSVLNCFLTPDAAHVFTDGALFTPDMTVAGFASKVIPLPHFPAVLSAVGSLWITPLMAAALAESTLIDFDDLLDAFPRIVETSLGKLPNGNTFGHFTAGLAGWSAKHGRPAFGCVRTFDEELPAFELQRATRYISPSQSHIYDGSILSLPFDPARPAESGLSIMQAQRKGRFRAINGEDQHKLYHAVGGFCQHTTVTGEGISINVLERWPDQVGRPVTPASKRSADGGFF